MAGQVLNCSLGDSRKVKDHFIEDARASKNSVNPNDFHDFGMAFSFAGQYHWFNIILVQVEISDSPLNNGPGHRPGPLKALIPKASETRDEKAERVGPVPVAQRNRRGHTTATLIMGIAAGPRITVLSSASALALSCSLLYIGSKFAANWAEVESNGPGFLIW